MSAAEDVAQHICSSLLGLRRRLDAEVVIAVARAVAEGAQRALEQLGAESAGGAPPLAPDDAWRQDPDKPKH